MNDPREPIQPHEPAPEVEKRYTPTAEFRFFVYDPEGDQFTYYKSAEDRDSDAKWIILGHLEDGWSESVGDIMAGELTAHCIRHDVVVRPKREDFASDKEHDDAMSLFGSPHWDYKCNYRLAPLTEQDEPEPA